MDTKMPDSDLVHRKHSRNAGKLATALLLAFASSSIGCATANCDAEARKTVPDGDADAIAAARAKCQKRLDDARRTLKKQEEERDAQDRRDAFRNRNDGRRR